MKWLRKFCELLVQNADEIIQTISLESGKTLADSRTETERAYPAFVLAPPPGL